MKIKFPSSYSDGDTSLWYENGKKVVDSNGEVNYMVQIPLDGVTGKSWRRKIGTFLAQEVLDIDPRRRSKWYIEKFPRGYALYEHRTGASYAPRTDHYLVGCNLGHIFRSPNEFALHAKHIFDVAKASDLSNAPACECKYCSRTPQSDISRHYFHMNLKKGKTAAR